MSSSSSSGINNNNSSYPQVSTLVQNTSDSNQQNTNPAEAPRPQQSPWVALPPNVVINILGRLDPHNLANAISTCPRWVSTTRSEDCPNGFEEIKTRSWSLYDPRVEFPNVNIQIIDETVWRRVFSDETLTLRGLSFDDADPLDGRALRAFLKGLDFSKIEGEGPNTGVTILTLPKGLTFNKLVALAASPKEGGRAAPFRYVLDRITQELGDISVTKTHRVAISNNILKESRGKTIQEREQMARNVGGEMPGFLSVATLCSLTYMSTPTDPPTRLFNEAPWTYTYCQERVGGRSLAVGGFASAGLRVRYHFSPRSLFDVDVIGVGFIRKF